MFKSLARILLTMTEWAAFWGIVGAAFAAVATVIQPDTGHIPREKVPLMIGVPSAMLGSVVGLVFACTAEAFHEKNLMGNKVRAVVLGILSACSAVVIMNVLAPSLLSVIPAGFIGGVLTFRYALKRQ